MTIAVYEKGTGRVRFVAKPQPRGPSELGARAPVNVGPAERVVSAVAGGALLALGWHRPGMGTAALSVLAGGLLYRGVSGHCPIYARTASGAGTRLLARGGHALTQEEPEQRRTITIGKPPEELFRAWQQAEVQCRIMAHFASVSGDGDGRLRWRVRAPLGKVLSFQTEPTQQRVNELLSWRTTPDSDLGSTWTLELRKAPANYGTEVTLRVRFEPAGALLPHVLNKLLGMPTRLVIERALRNFKALVESGEIPSTFHNASARRGARSDKQAPHALHASS